MKPATIRAIQKALSVASGGTVEAWLPDPLARQVIAFIRELNMMRRLVRSFVMNSRTLKRPKKDDAGTAYFIPDGVTATLSQFSGSSVLWEAKKLMAYTLVDMEAIEDSLPSVVEQVLRDFAEAVAEAEELAMLQGDPTHLATAPTPGSATDANWYVRDARLAFKGIFTAAGEAAAADNVDAAAGAFDTDMLNKALFNLGKYGRVKSKVIALAPSEQAANIRGNTQFHDASASGLALASFVSGLGSAGENDGLITVIYGVKVFETPQAPAGEMAVYHRDSPELGDRRRIRLKDEEVIESDQQKFVVSERIAFQFNYQDALTKIKNLSQTIVS